MLDIVIYYPCGYPITFNEGTVCIDWPGQIKRDIIKASNRLFNDENVSVTVIPVTADPQLNLVIATLYCGKRIQHSEKLTVDEFDQIIDRAFHAVFYDKRISVHTIFSDSSRMIGIAKNSRHAHHG